MRPASTETRAVRSPPLWTRRKKEVASSACRRVSQLLPHELGFIRTRLRPELLHTSVEDFRQIQVAILIGRDRMRAVELPREPAGPAPAVQVFPGQVVLHDA